jgi:hypothetical protein
MLPENFSKRLKSSKKEIHDSDYIQVEATKEDVIGYYTKIRDILPNERAFNVWKMDIMRLGMTQHGRGGKPICPVPFFTKKLQDIVKWESAANKYGVLPYRGAYLDQPLYVIEGFDVVRAADNLYNAKRMKEMKKKNKSNK